MKIHHWIPFGEMNMKLVFYEELEGHEFLVHNFYTKTYKKIKDGELFPEEFILSIPHYLLHDIVKGLGDLLTENNIKTENEHKVEGRLQATEKHLSDLRQLLKLK